MFRTIMRWKQVWLLVALWTEGPKASFSPGIGSTLTGRAQLCPCPERELWVFSRKEGLYSRTEGKAYI